MGLTSNNMLVLAMAVAAVLFVGTVWLWPRLARQNWRTVSGRVGLLLATQVALFACVGLATNQAFGFYASWADLFGQETEQGIVVDHSANGSSGGPLQVVSSFGVPGAPDAPPETGGRVQKVDIVGRTTRLVAPAYVYLPPEYFQPRYRTRTFRWPSC